MNGNRLVRSENEKMLAGVCGGLAAYLGVDPVLVRLAFVILLLASGVGLAIYVILWIVMPSESRLDADSRLIKIDATRDVTTERSRFSPAATVGIILILFGGFFLLNQFGWIGGAFWPLVLIGTGIAYLVYQARQRA